MAQWRKVIVSGSDAELRTVTASNGFLGTASRAVVGEKVDVFSGGSTTGVGVYTGSFSGSFFGTGTVVSITAGDGLSGGTISSTGTVSLNTASAHFITGSTKAMDLRGVFSSSGQVNGASITNNSVSYTAGSGLTGGGSATLGGAATTINVGAGLGITVNADDIAVNTGSAHFVTGARATISSTDTAGASGINLRYNSATGIISGSLVNSAVTVTAGNGLSGGGAVSLGGSTSLAVVYGSGSNTAVQGNQTITINGTANQVAVTGTAAQALGGGPSYTIGLPSDVTIGNNLTVNNDLIVLGNTVTLNTSNILVEDRYILLNSGSLGSSIEGGIIVQSGSNSSGSALLYSTVGSANRWAFVDGLASNATTATPTAYVAQVVDMNVTAHSNALASYAKNGNIRIDTNGDVFIYS